jgi:spore germination protein YaaH
MHRQPYIWRPAVFVLGIFLIVCSTRTVEADSFIRFGGWVTYWDFKRGMQTVAKGTGSYQDIFLFSIQLNAEGTPIVVNSGAIDYKDAVFRLKVSGFKPWMTIVNDVQATDDNESILKDKNIVHNILTDDDSRRKHRQKIIALAESYGVSGVDIDYENLLPDDRIPFTRFISELSADLKKRNLSLSVTVQPKTPSRSTLGQGAMDWSAICRYADRLQIMLYNLHNPKTKPGPVATLPWISRVLSHAKSQCSLDTLVPVLKISGMHWNTHKNEAIQYDQAMKLKAKHGAQLERETISQVPFFSYQTNDESGMVYFEDAHSLKIKIERIQSLGFKKVMFWSFGRQDPQLTSQLKDFKNDSP